MPGLPDLVAELGAATRATTAVLQMTIALQLVQVIPDVENDEELSAYGARLRDVVVSKVLSDVPDHAMARSFAERSAEIVRLMYDQALNDLRDEARLQA